MRLFQYTVLTGKVQNIKYMNIKHYRIKPV